MAGSAKTSKAKSVLSYDGYDYVQQGQRKDGSSTWRCSDRDCDGRLLKRGDSDNGIDVVKEHSIELPSIKSAVVHLGMNCIKERAINNPQESVEESIKNGMDRAKELMIACMPGPNVIGECIQKWKNPTAVASGSSTKEKTPKSRPLSKKRLILPRKRMKLGSEEEEEADDSSTSISKKRSRSSRSSSVRDDVSDTDDD